MTSTVESTELGGVCLEKGRTEGVGALPASQGDPAVDLLQMAEGPGAGALGGRSLPSSSRRHKQANGPAVAAVAFGNQFEPCLDIASECLRVEICKRRLRREVEEGVFC